MKYVNPLNASPATPGWPRAPYWNQNPALGQEGARVDGDAFTEPLTELVNLIEAAGLTPAEGDLTQITQAVRALIGQSVRRGRTMPEVLTGDARLTINAGTGEVIVASEQAFLWRGNTEVNTTAFTLPQRSFATLANKTYHLRWDAPGVGTASPATTWPNGRFALRDLADAAYNPSALAESNVAFDTALDSMIVARVVTNPSNVATITTLANMAELWDVLSGVSVSPIVSAGADNANYTWTNTTNWARRPVVASMPTGMSNNGAMGADGDFSITINSLSRYSHTVTMSYDFADQLRYTAILRA